MIKHGTCILFLILCFAGCSKDDPTKNPQNLSAEEAFSRIYEKAGWGRNKDGKPCSGPGSLAANAKPYMDFLQSFLKEKGIKSVVDVGCGDWEFSRELDWSAVRYLGFDVVRPVIERNQQLYQSENISFLHADVTQIDLPEADLFICKDVLQHLPTKDIQNICDQLAKFKYCLITNDVFNPSTKVSCNDDLSKRGGLRPLDLTQPPFNLNVKKVLSYKAHDQTVKEVVLLEKE